MTRFFAAIVTVAILAGAAIATPAAAQSCNGMCGDNPTYVTTPNVVSVAAPYVPSGQTVTSYDRNGVVIGTVSQSNYRDSDRVYSSGMTQVGADGVLYGADMRGRENLFRAQSGLLNAQRDGQKINNGIAIAGVVIQGIQLFNQGRSNNRDAGYSEVEDIPPQSSPPRGRTFRCPSDTRHAGNTATVPAGTANAPEVARAACNRQQ